MKASLKLFASLSKHLPAEAQRTSCLQLDLPPGTTVQQVIAHQGIPPELCSLVLLNGLFIPPEERVSRHVSEGDVLAIWPPVAGG